MPVSKNVILWLKGGGLKDDRDPTDNGPKDNDEKVMHTQTIKVLVLQRPVKTHPVHNKIILPTIVINFILTMIVD